MKTIKLTLIFVTLIAVHVKAQTYKIDTSEITYENKLRPCFNVKYDAPPVTVKKAWDKFFNKNYNVKIKGIGLLTNKDIITGTDVTIADISDKRMNLYAKITNVASGSELSYFMSFGYDFFIGSVDYSKEFAGMKKILNDFSMEFLNDYYADEASNLTSKIKSLEKDISKNNKSVKKNNRKAKKGSAEVANGLSAKNTAKQMENEENRRKISELNKQIENIKIKQQGLSRN
ncbi:MAG TPA: hypothetical protein PK987_03555 [Ferruginibacter sp.]|nr:hypothetical protein [Ferruginibacter sp.]